MRLDKYLSDMKCGTRSSLKKDIKNGLVTVNGQIIRNCDHKLDENTDEVCFKGIPCTYEKYVYYMLHKPAGVISATEDKKEKTVLSLLSSTGRNDLFPVGRLDKDTEGLLLLTNDGMLAHNLLSPGKHVEKVYECTLAVPITDVQIHALESGVDIGEKKPALPAKVTVIESRKITLAITEGKFHQVKRMLKAVGNEVLYLKRLRMGSLILDESLKPGEYRMLTKEEIMLLQSENTKDIPNASNNLHLDDFEAVIFDLDGSLVDSVWLWPAIDKEYLAGFGIEPPEDLHHLIGGRSFSETAIFFKETFQLPDELEQIKADWNKMAWDKYMYEVPLKDGAEEFIDLCIRKNIKLGIATSNSRELVENVMSVHGLSSRFACIMTGCDVKCGKPAPDIYLAAAKALDVLPERCLVFEDIVPGIMAGQAAGMKVCAVYDETSAVQDEEKRALADYYIYNFNELLKDI